ncbi:unknown protein (plasmid) [Photobacterium profundum SS9]|uniref:Uncharacterized protein n=1 Tax=Photobacterium profundum (strain SS9) TaxID=298386 RepID=Q6LW98_PHOPR|nr:unknown protein [Photobacterium profundum SS9]
MVWGVLSQIAFFSQNPNLKSIENRWLKNEKTSKFAICDRTRHCLTEYSISYEGLIKPLLGAALAFAKRSQDERSEMLERTRQVNPVLFDSVDSDD